MFTRFQDKGKDLDGESVKSKMRRSNSTASNASNISGSSFEEFGSKVRNLFISPEID